MRTKTIFEGTVNGVNVNSVSEYNQLLEDAIKGGKEIKASSKTYTKTIDEPDDKAPANESDKPINKSDSSAKTNMTEAEKNKILDNNLYYFFTDDPDNYYLDLFSGDNETDTKLSNTIQEGFDKTLNILPAVFNDLSFEDIVSNIRKVRGIYSNIKSDYDNTVAMIDDHELALKQIHQTADKINKELPILHSTINHAFPVFIKFYEGVLKELEKRLERYLYL